MSDFEELHRRWVDKDKRASFAALAFTSSVHCRCYDLNEVQRRAKVLRMLLKRSKRANAERDDAWKKMVAFATRHMTLPKEAI